MKQLTSARSFAAVCAICLSAALLLTGCGAANAADSAADDAAYEAIAATANVSSDGKIDASELFTHRDLTQNADLSKAVSITVSDGEDILIEDEGIYVLRGSASQVTITVEADSKAKVQLVLDGVSITNDDAPCISVVSADKVFVTTSADSSLTVTGSFAADSGADGVIFSRSDLTLNGTAALSINSSDVGIVCKDDLKVTGGSYTITAATKCMEANDSILIADGSFALTGGTDGLHAENDSDDTLGRIYICGGDFTINAVDDAIHALSVIQIDGGTFAITAREGLEGTYIQVNGGKISISAGDDGINGAQKSDAFYATVEITGGEIIIVAESEETDGIDCNGDLTITGGTINVTGSSPLDYDGAGTFTGGTLIVNGRELTSLPDQIDGNTGAR